ncbi:MAG: LysR family transcriptional regulator [Moorellales bacterium]
MTLHQLLIFRTVIEKGGFALAAEALRVSQSAISVQLKALEKELGCALVNRNAFGGKVEPTVAGRIAYEAIRRIFDQLDLLSQLRDFDGDCSGDGRVRVVSDIPTGIYLLPKLVNDFHSLHKAVVNVTVSPHRTLPSILRECAYELAIVPTLVKTPQAVPVFTFIQDLAAVVSPRFRSEYGELHWSNLPLVLPPPDTVLRRCLDAYFMSLGIRPYTVLELNHPEAVRKTVQTTAVVGITHRISVEEDLEAGTLAELEPPQPLPRLTYKVVRDRSRYDQHARAFASFLKERLLHELRPVDSPVDENGVLTRVSAPIGGEH